MTRRRRVPFNAERDYAAPHVLELVDEALADVEERADELRAEERAARLPARSNRPELPPAAPPPLGALELVWSLRQEWIEPFVVRSIEGAGGFRPMLERAGLRPLHSVEP